MHLVVSPTDVDTRNEQEHDVHHEVDSRAKSEQDVVNQVQLLLKFCLNRYLFSLAATKPVPACVSDQEEE